MLFTLFILIPHMQPALILCMAHSVTSHKTMSSAISSTKIFTHHAKNHSTVMWVTSLCQLSYCRAKRVDVTVTPKIEIIALNSTEWRGLCRLCVIYRFITTLPHLFSLLAIVLWAIGSCKNIQSTTTWATTVCKRNIYIIHNEDEKGLCNVYMYTVKVVRKYNSHYILHSWKAVIAYPTGALKFLGFFSLFYILLDV